jgi:hypothetical protein
MTTSYSASAHSPKTCKVPWLARSGAHGVAFRHRQSHSSAIIYAQLIDKTRQRLSDRANVTAEVGIQHVTKDFTRQDNLKGGNPQGIDK